MMEKMLEMEKRQRTKQEKTEKAQAFLRIWGFSCSLESFSHRSLAMAGYATQPLVGADSVKILIYQLALLYKG